MDLTPEQALDLSAHRAALKSGEARRERLDANLQLQELAAALGVSAVALNQYESGRRSPSAAVALRHAALLAELRERRLAVAGAA